MLNIIQRSPKMASFDDIDSVDTDQHQEMIPSFTTGTYESKEMQRLMALHLPDDVIPPGLQDISYESSDVFPEWILHNPMWRNPPKKVENSNEISEILTEHISKRTPEQMETITMWLMSVWPNAKTMGHKRCAAMFKEFNYTIYNPGENIITEGERGLTFYIIVSGHTVVRKEGVGDVGHLGKGKSFGEIALTQGKDLRTATVTAVSKVEVLSLHKNNYDIFVRDIQELERRENFQILSSCQLFKAWSKGKIEKMCNTCLRKTYEAGEYVFRQGDDPDDLLIVIDGGINIFKELVIITKNRWPSGPREWQERVRRIIKPIMLKTLQRGDYFGEVAILKNLPRSTSAIAQSRSTLISLDKNEFLHLVHYGTTAARQEEEAARAGTFLKYYGDEQVLETLSHLKGGPQSVAYVGRMRVEKATIEKNALTNFANDAEIVAVSPSHYRNVDGDVNNDATAADNSSPRPRSPSPTSPKASNKMVASRPQLIPLKPTRKSVVSKEEIRRQERKASVSEKIRQTVIQNKQRASTAGQVERSRRSTSPNPSIPAALNLTVNKGSVGAGASPPTGGKARAQSMRQRVAHSANDSRSRRGSISFAPGGNGHPSMSLKRNSLVGLDNDIASMILLPPADSNRMLMRRNSAIHLGQLYEQMYKQVQNETAASMDVNKAVALAASFSRKSSAMSMSGSAPQLTSIKAPQAYAREQSPLPDNSPGGEVRIRHPSRRDSSSGGGMKRTSSNTSDDILALLGPPPTSANGGNRNVTFAVDSNKRYSLY